MILARPPLCLAALLAVVAALSVETDRAVILLLPDRAGAVDGRHGSVDDAVAFAAHRFARDGHCWCVVERWEVAVSTPSAPATALLVTW